MTKIFEIFPSRATCRSCTAAHFFSLIDCFSHSLTPETERESVCACMSECVCVCVTERKREEYKLYLFSWLLKEPVEIKIEFFFLWLQVSSFLLFCIEWRFRWEETKEKSQQSLNNEMTFDLVSVSHGNVFVFVPCVFSALWLCVRCSLFLCSVRFNHYVGHDSSSTSSSIRCLATHASNDTAWSLVPALAVAAMLRPELQRTRRHLSPVELAARHEGTASGFVLLSLSAS